MGDTDDVVERDVDLAALDVADVGAVQTGAFGEPLLRDAPAVLVAELGPGLSDPFPECSCLSPTLLRKLHRSGVEPSEPYESTAFD